MTDARTVPAEPGARTARTSSFRPDVEGLRAIAILAVVGYHAGLPFLPGGFVGVDVFFVISGFLITGLLAAEVARTGTVSLRRFWARRARRLLPAATLVIAVTAVASWLMVPQVDHGSVGLDLVASALYVANIRFALQATDYLTEDAAPSPALHFWSLGVEEQFYLVWPLLVLAVVWLLLRRRAARASDSPQAGAGLLGGRAVPALALVLAVVGVLSFALSLRLTERVQPWAFFSMPTRAWEFAVGGLLALGVGVVARAPRLARQLVGWVGLVMLVGSVLLIDGDQPFPGTVAVWPVLGTAAVIAAGVRPPDESGRPLRGVPGLMALGPMRLVGRLSYSWYLWHWPVLVLAASALGELSLPVSLALVLLSLVPAALAYRYVEQPVRLSPVLAAGPGRSLRLGGALSATAAAFGLLLALLPGGGALATVAAPDAGGRGPAPLATSSPTAAPTPTATEGAGGPSSAPSPSATAITWPEGELTPDPSDARADLPVVYDDGCHLDIASTRPQPCVFGDEASDVTIVLLGDSHAAQWFPAVRKAAEDRGWRLVSWTKSGCPAPDVTIYQRRLQRAYDECDTWRSTVLDLLTSTQRPALVLAAGTRTESLQDRATGGRLEGTGRAPQEWQDGWRRTLSRLTEAGVPVAVLRDTPWPGVDMAACVGQNRDDPSACDVTRDALDATKYDVGLADEFDLASAVDLSDILCDADRCPATRGRYLVYRDTDHLTATFARALAPYMADRLATILATD